MKATSFLGHYVDGNREYTLSRKTHEYLLPTPTWPTDWDLYSILIGYNDYRYAGRSKEFFRRGIVDLVDWPQVDRDGWDTLRVNTVVNALRRHSGSTWSCRGRSGVST